MTAGDLWNQCVAILPELVVALALCVVIVADILTPLGRSRQVSGTLALLGTLGALAVVLARLGPLETHPTFNGMMIHDQLSRFLTIVFLISTAATILFSMRSREIEGYRQGEYYTLLLGALLGAMFLAGSNNFVMFILGMETLSICSYILAGTIKHERFSAEASLKYMIYGAVASGVMLFGISYVYGMTGTLEIGDGVSALCRGAVSGSLSRLGLMLVLVLLLAGIGFKCAMVPFHFWCPDVYQGSPTPVTAFLSVVSKAAGFGALLRVTLPFFSIGAGSVPGAVSWDLVLRDLPVFFGILSVVTMTFGNLVALRQTDVKRLLAYSSIAHAGYLLMGMTVFEPASIEAMLFYFFVYLFMNLGAFWVVIVLVNRLGGAEIERFRGAAFKAPFLFAAMFVFLISLTGLPPTAGFVGKFILFKVVIGAGISRMTTDGGLTHMATFYFLVALIGLINSAVSLYYYMKVARAMAFERPVDDAPLGDDGWDRAYAGAFAAATLALMLYFTPILQLIQVTAH